LHNADNTQNNLTEKDNALLQRHSVASARDRFFRETQLQSLRAISQLCTHHRRTSLFLARMLDPMRCQVTTAKSVAAVRTGLSPHSFSDRNGMAILESRDGTAAAAASRGQATSCVQERKSIGELSPRAWLEARTLGERAGIGTASCATM
jgi:hypothetical protein